MSGINGTLHPARPTEDLVRLYAAVGAASNGQRRRRAARAFLDRFGDSTGWQHAAVADRLAADPVLTPNTSSPAEIEGSPDGTDDGGWRHTRDANPLALDPYWRVPFHLEQDVLDVERKFVAFVSTGAIPTRTAGERTELEIKRHGQAWSMAFQLEERRSAGLRTEALFDDIQARGRPFVLFLRGFNNRITRFFR